MKIGFNRFSAIARTWHQKQARAKTALGDSFVYRLLGERLFDHRLWAIEKRSVAGGLSLGLFISFTPTIPFHMVLCTMGAILLRLNLPVSLAASWVMNPLTAVPIYLSTYRFGKYLLGSSGLAHLVPELFGFEGRMARFMENSLYIWTGALIFATAFALAGNLAVRLIWNRYKRLKEKKAESVGF